MPTSEHPDSPAASDGPSSGNRGRRKRRDYAYPRDTHPPRTEPERPPHDGMRRRRIRKSRSKTIFEENDLSGSVQALLFVLVIVGATTLCQVRLDASHFNLTESRVALLLEHPLGMVIANRGDTPLSRAGLALLSSWRELAGGSTITLRQWSMFTGLLAIGAMFLGSRRIVGRRAALWGACVVALSPVWFVHARSVLALHVVTLGTALWLGTLHRYLLERKTSTAIGYGASLALAAALHPACLVLFPIGLIVAIGVRKPVRPVAVVGAIAVAASSFVWFPDLYVVLRPVPFETLPGLPAMGSMNPLSWLPGVPFGQFEDAPVWAVGAGVLLATGLAALGLVGIMKGEPESFLSPRSEHEPRSMPFLRPLLLAWLLGLALSFATGSWVQAWGLISLPAAALFVGSGIERLVRWRVEHKLPKGEAGYRVLESRLTGRRTGVGILLALLAAPTVLGYVSRLGTWTESEPRAVAAFLSGRVRNGDLVVSVGADRELVGYALAEMAAPRVRFVERSAGASLDQADSLSAAMVAGRRVWVSLASGVDDTPLLDALSVRGHHHRVLSDSLLGVYCFSAPADSVPFKRRDG